MIRILLVFTALMVTSLTLKATPLVNSDSDSVAQSGALSGSNIDSHDRVTNHASDLSRAVPSTVVPNPSVGFAVCDSAYTIGGSFAGFGAAIGVPVSDSQCNLREDAKTTKMIGEPVIAKELMCSSVRFFKSSYRAGRPCFPDKAMLEELSEDEMEIYESIMISRNNAKAQKIQQSQAQPTGHDLAQKQKIEFVTRTRK